MTAPAGTAVGVLLLVAVLVWAVARPFGWSEAVVAVPAACVALASGLVSPRAAGATLGEFGPTLAFLAAVLVLAGLADVGGVFRWLGALIVGPGRTAGGLLGVVFVVAAGTTAVLSLDATVVLLTPAVITAVRRAGVRPAPALYATAHLSNTASLLLPVSNLTSLLAFHVTGLTFVRFAALMALPFAVCLAVEYLVFRVFFAADLRAGPSGGLAGGDGPSVAPADPVAPPRRVLVTLAAVLVGFALAPLAGIPAYLVAVAGAVALAVPALARRRIGVRALAGAARPGFLLFVAALLVVVDAATGHGLDTWLAARLPDGTALPSLLALAGVGALLACLINNLPATLVLLQALGAHPAAGAVLAVLIGVNIGPNLTYAGSLAVLLWRRVLRRHSYTPSIRRFTALGVATVPLCLLAGTAALWLALQV